MIQLLCDGADCGQLIQDGTERVDVTIPTGPPTPPGAPAAPRPPRYTFHLPCFTAAGPVVPRPGLTVIVTRVAAVPATPTLPEPLRAP